MWMNETKHYVRILYLELYGPIPLSSQTIQLLIVRFACVVFACVVYNYYACNIVLSSLLMVV